MPKAIAAAEPIPAPSPIARVDVPDEGAGGSDVVEVAELRPAETEVDVALDNTVVLEKVVGAGWIVPIENIKL